MTLEEQEYELDYPMVKAFHHALSNMPPSKYNVFSYYEVFEAGAAYAASLQAAVEAPAQTERDEPLGWVVGKLGGRTHRVFPNLDHAKEEAEAWGKPVPPVYAVYAASQPDQSERIAQLEASVRDLANACVDFRRINKHAATIASCQPRNAGDAG